MALTPAAVAAKNWFKICNPLVPTDIAVSQSVTPEAWKLWTLEPSQDPLFSLLDTRHLRHTHERASSRAARLAMITVFNVETDLSSQHLILSHY